MDLQWLKTHLILIAVVAALVCGGVYGALSLIDNHDAKVAVQYQVLATQAAAQNAQFQQSVLAQQQQLASTIASLEQQLAQRQTIEVKLPAQTAALNANQVATQIGGGATAQSDSTILLPLPVAQIALSDMQLVPMLQADKVQLQAVVDDTKKQLDLEKRAHKSDVDALNAQIVADNKQITKLKADARKGYLRWFGIGYVAGFVSRQLVKP